MSNTTTSAAPRRNSQPEVYSPTWHDANSYATASISHDDTYGQTAGPAATSTSGAPSANAPAKKSTLARLKERWAATGKETPDHQRVVLVVKGLIATLSGKQRATKA